MTMYSADEKIYVERTGTSIVRWSQLGRPNHWHGDGTTFYYSQANAYNDCIHRNIGKILLFVDMDDLIITQAPTLWSNLLDGFKEKKYSAIKMPWIDFPCNEMTKTLWGDNSSTIWTNLHLYKLHNTKVIVKGDQDIEMGIHDRLDWGPKKHDYSVVAMHRRRRPGVICPVNLTETFMESNANSKSSLNPK